MLQPRIVAIGCDWYVMLYERSLAVCQSRKRRRTSSPPPRRSVSRAAPLMARKTAKRSPQQDFFSVVSLELVELVVSELRESSSSGTVPTILRSATILGVN